MAMKNEEILKKAIKKAVEGGFEFTMKIHQAGEYNDFNQLLWADYNCIFSHSFAKAFWGEKRITTGFKYTIKMKAWEYHLSEMVLEEDPLEYIEQFLEIEENDKD